MTACSAPSLRRVLQPARLALLAWLLMLGAPAQAAALDGSQLSPMWAVPFVGILLSIAIWPLAGPLRRTLRGAL